MRNNNEIEEVKNLCKACLPILVEYIEAIDVDFYNIVLYQQTDKYRSYDELFEIIRIFCRDNQELYLKIRDFESVQFCISFLDLTTIYEYFINFQQSLYDLFEEHKKLCVHLYEAFHLNGKTLKSLFVRIYINIRIMFQKKLMLNSRMNLNNYYIRLIRAKLHS